MIENMWVNYLRLIAFIIAIFCIAPVYALTFQIERNSDLVGKVQYVTVQRGDTMQSIAREYDVGFLEMQKANPKVNPYKLKPGTELVIPTLFILPPGPRQGMVINLAELRVYYYPPGSNQVITHPLGIGRQGWLTPVGQTRVIQKREEPYWTPPDSIRAYNENKGIYLPEVIPPGPHNPLGHYAIYLGWNRYLMHGTNAPHTVGVRSSSGCIRMLPEDIEHLFPYVDVGTKVTVIHVPYKVGTRNGAIYMEAHEPFPETYYNEDGLSKHELFEQELYENDVSTSHIDWGKVNKAIRAAHGIPVNITDYKAELF